MNRIYRVIRSRTYNRDVVVSEITKTTGKSKHDVRTVERGHSALKSSLLGAVVAGLMAFPMTVLASEITGLDGKSLITASDKVHNLYAQQINSSKATGSVGVSKYGKFNVTQGDIANMHFNKKDGTVYADSLVNLVNSKINIAGTVNALKDNRLGGHLYFLSPEGMAVSKSGVINAGQFTAMVPTTKLFKDLRDGSADSFNTHFYDYVMEKGKIDDLSDWYSQDNKQNIQIDGAINTRSGIKLRASKIDITQGAKLLSNQKIDFTSLVNTKDSKGNPVDAGLSGVGMTAVKDDTTGDIVLKAGVESYADDVLSPATAWVGNKVTTRKAFINVDGAVETDGNVEIGAEAKTTFKEGSVFNVLDETDLIGKILGDIGTSVMADFADKTNTTHIQVGKTGSITSTGKTTISAANTVDVRLNAATPAKKTGSGISDALPVLGIGVVKQVNNALVDVNGDIASKGDLTLKASADTTVEMKVKSATELPDDPGAPEPNLIYISLGVIASDTNAAVNLHAGDKKITAGGAVDISANASEDLSLEVESSAPDKTFASTAIGVIDSDSDASVIIDRSIEAKGKDNRKKDGDNELPPWVNIVAGNTSDNATAGSITVSNTLGGISYEAPFKPKWQEDPGITDVWLDPLIGFVHGKADTLLQKIKTKLGRGAGSGAGGAGGDVASNFLSNLGTYLKPGVSLAVDLQDNTAQIKVGDGVVIDAGKANDISLNTRIDMGELNVVAEGVGNNQEDDQQTKVMVAVGVEG
ncbi:MAG: leukotoxin LktA family filamentous adhesin, partial [Oxalobacter sp.]|nr:leukotoxin LktA family filamentous adhesin [Oxalobacter sp.]